MTDDFFCEHFGRPMKPGWKKGCSWASQVCAVGDVTYQIGSMACQGKRFLAELYQLPFFVSFVPLYAYMHSWS